MDEGTSTPATTPTLDQLLVEQGLPPFEGSGSITIDDLTEDSRKVRTGSIFLARSGAVVDGRDFIAQAEAAGAAAVLTDAKGAAQAHGPVILTDDPAGVGAKLAHAVHGDPSDVVQVAGITGTNGKTTCAVLLQHLLNAAGRRCGRIGGIDVDDGGTGVPTAAALTTPAACEIAGLLGRMRDNRCVAAAMEVSSQAIATGRLDGTRFAAAIFTNLSGDHLDLHGDMETYRQCKLHWLESLGDVPRIVNIDDAAGSTVRGDRITVGVGGDVQFSITQADLEGQRLTVQTPWGQADLVLPLTGAHNAMNAAQSLAAACSMGASFDSVCAALSTAPTPRGRLQMLARPDGAPRVFVDFAHTDGALDAMLSSVRPLVPSSGRLIVVFGCGGDRDTEKRPRMAAAACRHAEVVWLTSDNPRSEDPDAILDHIECGVPDGACVHRQVDRATAIAGAIAMAGADDVIVIAGKGHECVQLIGDRSVEFNDVQVAGAALQQVVGQ